ncbi:hypothetical protein MP228_007334 [Amoeboaphelidium protococcarum]|nr:hypothetical protein MP228_007334 [Amoeboaphelidium protococcarum]
MMNFRVSQRYLSSSNALYALRNRRPMRTTPPTWYQKNAVMYGRYNRLTNDIDRIDKAAVSEIQDSGDIDQSTAGWYYTSLAPSPKQCNVIDKKLWSVILQRWVRFKISSAALREIDRKGGLDEYFLLTEDEDLGGAGSVSVQFKQMLQSKLNKVSGQQQKQSVEPQLKSEYNKYAQEWKKMLDNKYKYSLPEESLDLTVINK